MRNRLPGARVYPGGGLTARRYWPEELQTDAEALDSLRLGDVARVRFAVAHAVSATWLQEMADRAALLAKEKDTHQGDVLEAYCALINFLRIA